MYKTSKAAEEAGIQHSPQDKENMKTAYSTLKKHNSSITIDKKSSDALYSIMNSAFNNQCPPIHKKFIHDYHIAFIQQSNPKMKERFYDKLFPNTPTQSLDKLNDFLEGMKSVAKAFTKLDNEISKHVTMCWRSSSWKRVEMIENAEKTKAAYKDFYNKIWENDSPVNQAFENYDVKVLKSAAKQMIEDFRSQWGFETKAMLKKSTKN